MNPRAAAILAFVLAAMPAISARGDEKEKAAPPAGEFETLSTKDGTEYFDCQVVRVEPDALVVRHRNGIARVSFFDLSREIRETYDFDPFAAIDHYRKETERQREIRWQTFWEKQRHEAKVAGEEETKKLVKKALAEWIPVEAKVVRPVENGFLAQCKQVTFEKTTKRSKLGFLVDGPPKRKLVDFAGGNLILLRPVNEAEGNPPKRNSTWKGYVSPFADARGTVPGSAPVYQAVHLP